MPTISAFVSPPSYGAPYIAIIAAAAFLYLAYRAFNSRANVDVPLVFSELDVKSRAHKWATECNKVMERGHQLFRSGQASAFRATLEDGSETVIIHEKYLREIKALPDSVVSMKEGVDAELVAPYTHIKVVDPLGQHAIRSDLTPGLPRLMPVIASEAVAALDNFFPQKSGEWIPLVAFPAVLNAVAQVSARLFVGARLCRDPRWLKCSQTVTMKAFATVGAMKKWPTWMRPFAQYFESEKQSLEQARAEAIAILTEDAIANENTKDKDQDRDYLLPWVADRNPAWAKDYAAQADLQLELSVAAIHTTTMALTHMLFDLAANPQYTGMLREEVKTALAETGGVYNKDCIAKMVITDSFMKESQRLHPPSYTTFKRLALKQFNLSDGTVIPKGTLLQADTAIRYRDPITWENADQFDGLRFVRLAENDTQKGRHQFVSANENYVFWGQGKHACPGRFFAANEIKTLLAMFVSSYDIALEDGAGRPADHTDGGFINPDTAAKILVKRI